MKIPIFSVCSHLFKRTTLSASQDSHKSLTPIKRMMGRLPHNANPPLTSIFYPFDKAISFQATSNSDSNGINLRGILNDIETLSQDIMNMQFSRKLSIEAKSMENVTSSSELPDIEKPYKSEINLLILNPGDNSPPPNVPEPMQPIYPYQYGFERFDIPVQTVPFVAFTQPPQIPQLPLQIPVTSQEPVIIPNVYTIPAVPVITPPSGDQPPTVKMRSLSAEAKRQIFKNRTNDSTMDIGKLEGDEDKKHNSSGTGEVSFC